MAIAHVATSYGFASGSGVGGNMATGSTGSSKAFTYTATGTGNLVVIWTTQSPNPTSPTTCSLSATGWSFTQIGTIINGGTSAGCGALFWAYAPNTSLATITATWNQTSANWFSDLIDEFSGMALTSPIDASNAVTGTGTPTVSVTPVSANTMIWVPCNDSVTAVGTIGGTTATLGSNDTQQDFSEWRLLSGGAGSATSCTFTGSSSYIIGAVAIKPAAAAAPWHPLTAGSFQLPSHFRPSIVSY